MLNRSSVPEGGCQSCQSQPALADSRCLGRRRCGWFEHPTPLNSGTRQCPCLPQAWPCACSNAPANLISVSGRASCCPGTTSVSNITRTRSVMRFRFMTFHMPRSGHHIVTEQAVPLLTDSRHCCFNFKKSCHFTDASRLQSRVDLAPSMAGRRQAIGSMPYVCQLVKQGGVSDCLKLESCKNRLPIDVLDLCLVAGRLCWHNDGLIRQGDRKFQVFISLSAALWSCLLPLFWSLASGSTVCARAGLAFEQRFRLGPIRLGEAMWMFFLVLPPPVLGSARPQNQLPGP